MVYFFGESSQQVYAVDTITLLSDDSLDQLTWLFSDAPRIDLPEIIGDFIGPRITMITPWSTNAVEITQNMGILDIHRIECFFANKTHLENFDPMLHQRFETINQSIFEINITPEPIRPITDIKNYNEQEGLSLSKEEVSYLNNLSDQLGRPLTDSEVFGFSQVNSEHCRHKIFNGRFIIDDKLMPYSLFDLIRQTAKRHPNRIVSAYKDNVAFVEGPVIEQFAPKRADQPDYYKKTDFESVISLKAETHNFPTTVEPFNGAATGSGGEIRDRMAGGTGSVPLIGTAVYMTSYPRLEELPQPWEVDVPEREWLYQTPSDILIKASDGASDFGNKFGQPLLVGSLLTFEHREQDQTIGYDKVIMLAGGVGYAKKEHSQKHSPNTSDKILLLGGDNYRIGMGGAAVSSADTGVFGSGIELNAVQRSNPEMQKRVANTIRALVESEDNPIRSIHDHGAGGHLNCLSELVEKKGGQIDLSKLPLGDKTLSAKEIIGNESQERMGLVITDKDSQRLQRIADRERSPIYEVGYITGDGRFTIASSTTGEQPLDLHIDTLFGDSPEVVITDQHQSICYTDIIYEATKIPDYLKAVLRLEAVACKDWLTNKVDRCVGGRTAKQQCVGSLQLPLNNVGVIALDYKGVHGIATSIGHTPISGLVDPTCGSRNSIAEALTNIIWAPLHDGLKGVSLSANWMWPCKNKGEDARLYDAVKACADFAIELGINIPTGKDSLSMTQKYDNIEVKAPGTVIISATAHCHDIRQVVEPVLQLNGGSIYYINLSRSEYALGGSSLAQVLSSLGTSTADICDANYFKNTFEAVQKAIRKGWIIAGHDISSGGLITTLLEMCFSSSDIGASINLTTLDESDMVKLLFAENAGIVLQADSAIERSFITQGIDLLKIGEVNTSKALCLRSGEIDFEFDIPQYRDIWYRTSYLLDSRQSGSEHARNRFDNYKNQPLKYVFPKNFSGKYPEIIIKNRPKAAIIREKGSNSEREMANALYMAGFEVKDVHMTDLVSGREDLSEIRFLGAVGGFSNSDVLGSAKGWAGTFLYNQLANKALNNFFDREDTLSLGICNGCQLFVELGLIDSTDSAKMLHNSSKKFECAFTSIELQENHSVMMKSLSGARLGIWTAHAEGKFSLSKPASEYHIVGKYGYEEYPASPNGSDYNVAMMASKDGRHLISMPHFERSLYPWNWAHYPKNRFDNISPWIEAFTNAYQWM